jgi:hypothetical protein
VLLLILKLICEGTVDCWLAAAVLTCIDETANYDAVKAGLDNCFATPECEHRIV